MEFDAPTGRAQCHPQHWSLEAMGAGAVGICSVTFTYPLTDGNRAQPGTVHPVMNVIAQPQGDAPRVESMPERGKGRSLVCGRIIAALDQSLYNTSIAAIG